MIINKSLNYSPTLRFNMKVQELKREGKSIISLGLGEPNYDTPEHIKQAAMDALWAGQTRYSAAPGLRELRERVANKLKIENGIEAEHNEIIITPGAKNALFIACAAILRPGDEVINITPCYVSNIPIIKLAEPRAIVHQIPLCSDSFRIDRDKVKAAINKRTRLLFTNYPNNPSGKMLDIDDFIFLKDLMKTGKYYWLSDEVYERLNMTNKNNISPASNPEISGRVITVNGFSKSYSMTGWRIGYSHAFKELTSVMLKIHQHINTNTAAFIQRAAIAALAGSQEHIERFINHLKVQASNWYKFINRNSYFRSSPVEGGIFGFLNVGACRMSSDNYCALLLEEEGVAVIPGISFGKDFDKWVRISLSVSEEELNEGLKRIERFTKKLLNEE